MELLWREMQNNSSSIQETPISLRHDDLEHHQSVQAGMDPTVPGAPNPFYLTLHPGHLVLGILDSSPHCVCI